MSPSLAQRVAELAIAVEQGRARLRVVGSEIDGNQRAALLRQDLAEGRVFGSDGNVRFGASSFLEEPGYKFDGQAPWTLCFADEILRRPLPGPHRLYGLAHSGLIVGAEAYAPDPVEAYRGRLNAVHGLTNADLASLRAGQKTPAVAQIIRSGARTLRIIAWIALATVLLPLGFGALVGMEQWTLFELFGIGFGWPILLLPIPPLASIAAHREASRLARDQYAEIIPVEGATRRGTVGSGKSKQHFVEIDGEMFKGTHQPNLQRLYDVVVPGWPTRGYVTSGTRTLVAMEPLPLPGA